VAHKVQAQAGGSLSDIYDVKGGQAPIDRLITAEVQLIHEMGDTILSERYSQFIRLVAQGNPQNTAIAAVISDLPAGVSRVHGVVVTTDITSRLTHVAVSLEDTLGTTPRAIPIWVWDGTNEDVVRFMETTVQNHIVLRPRAEYTQLPNIITGPDQPQRVSNIALRGLTSGFGAGNVVVTAVIHISFAAIGGISSRGLPIPSW